MRSDLVNSIGVVSAVAPAVIAATNTSAAIDLANFDGATVLINAGAVAGSGNMTPKLQHSPTTTSGDFEDVTAADLIGAFPTVLEAATSYKVGYKGNRRYVRTVLTLNSGTSVAVSAVVVRSTPTNAPVA
jgi:hypothetical protein